MLTEFDFKRETVHVVSIWEKLAGIWQEAETVYHSGTP